MKKLFVSAFMLFGLAFSSNAQDGNAIGLRVSNNIGTGMGVEASFQTYLGKKNRLQLDLGFRKNSLGLGNGYGYGYSYYYYGYNGNNAYINGYDHNAIKLMASYQWVFEITNDIKWHIGPAVGGGYFSSKNYPKYDSVNGNYTYTDKTGAFGAVAASGGAEYNFKFPLQVGLDVRPEYYFSPDYVDARDGNLGVEIGISARYRF